jgi:hypothetical protein
VRSEAGKEGNAVAEGRRTSGKEESATSRAQGIRAAGHKQWRGRGKGRSKVEQGSLAVVAWSGRCIGRIRIRAAPSGGTGSSPPVAAWEDPRCLETDGGGGALTLASLPFCVGG